MRTGLARLRGLRSDLIDPAITAHRGRIVKHTGDGAIIEFRSVVDAVRCAIEVQTGLIERNAGVPEDRRIELRGIHLGDVVEEARPDGRRSQHRCAPGNGSIQMDPLPEFRSESGWRRLNWRTAPGILASGREIVVGR